MNLGINYYIRLESEDGRPLYDVCSECRGSAMNIKKK